MPTLSAQAREYDDLASTYTKKPGYRADLRIIARAVKRAGFDPYTVEPILWRECLRMLRQDWERPRDVASYLIYALDLDAEMRDTLDGDR